MRALVGTFFLIACTASRDPRVVECPVGTRLERHVGSLELVVQCRGDGGVLEGPSVVMNFDGGIRSRSEWRAGGKTGAMTTFFPNGQRKEEGRWADGQFDGPWTEWNESGVVTARIEYERGRTFRRDGKVISALSSPHEEQHLYIARSPQQAVVRLARVEQEFPSGAGGEFNFFELVAPVRGEPGPWLVGGGHAQFLHLAKGHLYAVGIEPQTTLPRFGGPSVKTQGYVTGAIAVDDVDAGVALLRGLE